MLRVSALAGDHVQQAADEPLPKGSFQSDRLREKDFVYHVSRYCGCRRYVV